MLTRVRLCLLPVVCVVATSFWSLSANAQTALDDVKIMNAAAASGNAGHHQELNTQSQTSSADAQGAAPVLPGTFNPVFADSTDVTIVSGVNTAGNVRVNNLANDEALFNIIANGLEILGLAWGAHFGLLAFMHLSAGDGKAKGKVLCAFAGTIGGFAAPGIINWLVASARDANLFS